MCMRLHPRAENCEHAASSRASSRVASAEPAAVRVAVMYVPSINATRRPVLLVEQTINA